jgi:hypothetical protein
VFFQVSTVFQVLTFFQMSVVFSGVRGFFRFPCFFQGGPGATSLFGLFKENGPIRSFAKDKPVSGQEEETEQQKLKDQGPIL